MNREQLGEKREVERNGKQGMDLRDEKGATGEKLARRAWFHGKRGLM